MHTRRTARDESLDDLRARLYRPEATSEDVERYTALRDLRAPAQTAPEVPRPRPPGRRVAALALVGTAVTGAVVVAAAVSHPAPAPVPAAVRAEPSRSTSIQVDGPSWSTSADSGGPGWSTRFNGDTAPSAPVGASVDRSSALSIDGVPAVAQRFHGRGGARVRLVGTAPGAGGRLIVQLASPSPDRLGWRATAGVLAPRVVARGVPKPRDSGETASVSALGPDAPDALVVIAPPDAPWSLTVVVLPGPDADLH